jgi:NADH dehydrogenase
MNDKNLHAVTGAFGYSGKYIAGRLLASGQQVITLTNSVHRRNPFGKAVKAHPFHFDDPERLTESLRNVQVLYNTYWVRFNHKTFTYAEAERNTKVMFEAARKAGVERIVHVSVTNPAADSPFEYFRGKATLETALKATGISYAILRPTVLFGKEDILINNIAWALRRFPVFAVFGNGRYRLQPLYVDDLAELAVTQGNRRENVIIDAIGPETFTYRGLVQEIGRAIGKRRPIVSLPPSVGYLGGWVMGKIINDVVTTRDEILGLMDNLFYVASPPAGRTKLSEWAKEHAESLGRHYASEMARRRDRVTEYLAN